MATEKTVVTAFKDWAVHAYRPLSEAAELHVSWLPHHGKQADRKLESTLKAPWVPNATVLDGKLKAEH